MEEKKMKFKEWLKANKKKLLCAGISVTTILGVMIGIKNREAIMEMWEFFQETINDNSIKISMDIQEEKLTSTVFEKLDTARKYTSPKAPYDVQQHIRTLSEGRHHSPEKALEAAAIGIVLLPNETLVNQHSKGNVA